MNTSCLKFPNKNKSIVKYKNHTFECVDKQTSDNSFTYNCIHKDCGSSIVLDIKKTKIINSNLEHMNHSIVPIKERLRSHVNKNQTNLDAQKNKRLSFSVQPVISPKPSEKLVKKPTIVSNNSVEGKKLNESEIPKHQSQDASHQKKSNVSIPIDKDNQKKSIPIDKDNHNVDSCLNKQPNTSNISHEHHQLDNCAIDTGPITNPEKSIQSNVTAGHKVSITCIGIQTDDDTYQSWEAERNSLKCIIQQRDHKIVTLTQRVNLLENEIRDIKNSTSKNKNKNPHHKESNPTQTSNVSKPAVPENMYENKSKLFLVGDSHVRGLQQILSKCLPENDDDVISHFQPGAGFYEVSQVHNISKLLITPSTEDALVIFCGTNDIGSTQWMIVQEAVDNLLIKFQHVRQICIIGVPFRFNNKKLNYHITRFNTKLKNYVLPKFHNVCYLDPNRYLRRENYLLDGLHLNSRGKTRICNQIINCFKYKSTNVIDLLPDNTHLLPNHQSVLCQDLITLDDFEESIQTHIANNVHCTESTFSSEVISDTSLLFPNTSLINNTCINILPPSNSILETPNPISKDIVEPSYSHDFYKIANLSQISFYTNATHSSPIPTIPPGMNRHDDANFHNVAENPKT